MPGERNLPLFVRSCDPRMRSIRLPYTPGDLVLGNARLYAANQHEGTGAGGVFDGGKRLEGQWRAFKTLVILSGAEATLRVPARDRSNFLLAYDPSHVKNFAYLRSDGQAAVRFINCTPRHRTLEFPGSLLARRPGCYHVQATSRRGSVLASGVVNIGMGEGACGSPTAPDRALRTDLQTALNGIERPWAKDPPLVLGKRMKSRNRRQRADGSASMSGSAGRAVPRLPSLCEPAGDALSAGRRVCLSIWTIAVAASTVA